MSGETEQKNRRSGIYCYVAPKTGRRDRPWESIINRSEILFLLQGGRYMDLIARLLEARSFYPHDLELIRSIRVLEHHLKEVCYNAG